MLLLVISAVEFLYVYYATIVIIKKTKLIRNVKTQNVDIGSLLFSLSGCLLIYIIWPTVPIWSVCL